MLINGLKVIINDEDSDFNGEKAFISGIASVSPRGNITYIVKLENEMSGREYKYECAAVRWNCFKLICDKCDCELEMLSNTFGSEQGYWCNNCKTHH